MKKTPLAPWRFPGTQSTRPPRTTQAHTILYVWDTLLYGIPPVWDNMNIHKEASEKPSLRAAELAVSRDGRCEDKGGQLGPCPSRPLTRA